MNGKHLAIVVAGAVAPVAAPALDVSVSGQVNRAIRFADNSAGSDVQHIDGFESRLRFRLAAESDAMLGITAGAHIEHGSSKHGGDGVGVESADGEVSFDARYSLLYFSGNFGEVTMGKATSAGNGVMWSGHSGAWMGTEYSADTASGLGVWTTGGTATEYPVFSCFPSVSIGRKDTLRCDTPSIGPVTDGFLEVDVRQERPATPKGDKKVVPIVPDGYTPILRSIPNVYVGYNHDERHVGEDYEDRYINVAHTWGSASVAIDYRTTEKGGKMESSVMGLGVQYSLGSGVDVYAGFNSYSFDAPGMDLGDVNAFHIGSPVVFK